MANIRNFSDFNLDDILINPDDIQSQDEEALDNTSEKIDANEEMYEDDEYEPDYENDFEEQSEYVGSPPASITKSTVVGQKNDGVFGNVLMASDLVNSLNNSGGNEYSIDSYHSYKSEKACIDENTSNPSHHSSPSNAHIARNMINLPPAGVDIIPKGNTHTSPSTVCKENVTDVNSYSYQLQEANECTGDGELPSNECINENIENENLNEKIVLKDVKKITAKPTREYEASSILKDRKVLSSTDQFFQKLAMNSVPLQQNKKFGSKKKKELPLYVKSNDFVVAKLKAACSIPPNSSSTLNKPNTMNKNDASMVTPLNLNQLDQYINKTVDAKLNKYITQQQREQMVYNHLAKNAIFVSDAPQFKKKSMMEHIKRDNGGETEKALQNAFQHDRNYKYNMEYMQLLKSITGIENDSILENNAGRVENDPTVSDRIGINESKSLIKNDTSEHQPIVSSKIHHSSANSNSNTPEKMIEKSIKRLNLDDFLSLDTLNMKEFISSVEFDENQSTLQSKKDDSNVDKRFMKIRNKKREKSNAELKYIFHCLSDSSEDIYSQFITDVIGMSLALSDLHIHIVCIIYVCIHPCRYL